MKTYVPKKDEVERQWWLIDADGRILGRLATQVANLLRGKNKPQYVDFMDTGDFVVVVNAEKIKVTGKKLDQKKYYSHTGYPGGIKEKTLRELMDKKPEEVIRKAVWGMLPKNKLNRAIHKKLKVYAGPPQETQGLCRP
jgi:large subunit ribosomal protein L13